MTAYALEAHSGPALVARVTTAGEIEVLDPAYAADKPGHLRSIEAYAKKVREWADRRPREEPV